MPDPGLTNTPSPAALASVKAIQPPSRRIRRRHGLQASSLLPVSVQNGLQDLYDVAAALHTVTDTPEFIDETREFLLDCIEQALNGTIPETEGPPTAFTASAIRLYRRDPVLAVQWAQRLLQAARRDVARPTCATWSDLMLYARYKAEPLGRATLGLAGVQNEDVQKATDALTAALLVLHLVRTAGTDWRLHGRCFLPTDWFAEEGGTPEHLVERHTTVVTRNVINRVLDRTERLLVQALPLPDLLEQPRLRAEAVRLIRHARYQLAQLRTQDPLRRPLKTPIFVKAIAYLSGWRAARKKPQKPVTNLP